MDIESNCLTNEKNRGETGLVEIPVQVNAGAGGRMRSLAEEVDRYAFWISPQLRHLNKLIDLLGWRVSRAIRSRMGRPEGAILWPLGLALLGLNASSNGGSLLVRAKIITLDALDFMELRNHVHVDFGGLLYAGLYCSEIYGDKRQLNRIKNFGDIFLNRIYADVGEVSYSVNRKEVFIDTIGMLCPFMSRLSRITGDERYVDLSIRQINSFLAGAISLDGCWPFHAYHVESRELLGQPGWGRGLGWLSLGIVDTAAEMSEGVERDKLMALALHWLRRVIQEQRPDGHWSWLLADATTHIDSSVTAMIAYSLARLRLISSTCGSEFDDAICLARRAINSSTSVDGRVLNASGEAGGFGSYAETFGSYLWAQGPAVAIDLMFEKNSSNCSL